MFFASIKGQLVAIIDHMIDIKTINQIISDSLRPIASILADDTVTEIMVTADGSVWVERKGAIALTDICISEADRSVALTTVGKANGGAGVDMISGTEQAVVSTSVGGLRFAGALKGVDSRGTTITIRKHLEPEMRPTLDQLVQWDMLTVEQGELLTDLIINQKKNCVFAGPTSGGKTTLANAILMGLPKNERIGLIEDAREMALRVENKECMLATPQTGLTAKVLIQHAMRSRFDRLILSETRGDDTYDLLRALSSGHNGSVTTLHASSALGALSTLEMLFQMSLPSGVQMSPAAAQRYITSCINLIVFCERRYVKDGDVHKSVRRVAEIALVHGVENGEYKIDYLLTK